MGMHGMRGDGVGVGDVGEVPCGTRVTRDAAGGDDGRGSKGKHDAGLVVDMAGMSVAGRGNRGGTGSASMTVHGASMGLVAYTGKARHGHDGMRGDGVGVGDVGEVPCGTRITRHATGGDDGGGARRQHDAGMVW